MWNVFLFCFVFIFVFFFFLFVCLFCLFYVFVLSKFSRINFSWGDNLNSGDSGPKRGWDGLVNSLPDDGEPLVPPPQQTRGKHLHVTQNQPSDITQSSLSSFHCFFFKTHVEPVKGKEVGVWVQKPHRFSENSGETSLFSDHFSHYNSVVSYTHSNVAQNQPMNLTHSCSLKFSLF